MFIIDKYSHIPVYEQIIHQVEHNILSGVLKADSILPSVRTLSVELSINPNTMQKAFSELERRGLCYSVPGNGRFVSRNAVQIIRDYKMNILIEIQKHAAELFNAGIPVEQIHQCIDEAYAKFLQPSQKEVKDD